MGMVLNCVARLHSLLASGYLLARFVANEAGQEHGVGRVRKLRLARRIIRNSRRVKSISTWQQHLILVEEILRVPKSLKGAVVECGCFNGASTISLSLACALTDRTLFVCDSFQGLPPPEPGEQYDVSLAELGNYYSWQQGEFSSDEGLAGVQRNVEMFGDIGVCRFIKGYFHETLRDAGIGPIVLVFEDADLASSVRDCLRYLWPSLQDGCKFYSHEPWSNSVVALFYDTQWWRTNLGTAPPGFYGSGRGIAVGLSSLLLGYAQKFSSEQIEKEGHRIVHIGSSGYTE